MNKPAAALDIETIPNESIIEMLPEPEVLFGNMKDPAKIEEKRKEAKQKQIEKMGLYPISGRVCSFAFYSEDDQLHHTISEITDAEEIELIAHLMDLLQLLYDQGKTIVTWNGLHFDFPYFYKRAALLKMDLPKANSLSFWTRGYLGNPHCDLMQVWNNWDKSEGRTSLDFVGKIFLGKSKTERNYLEYVNLIKKGESKKIGLDNLCDAEITYKLYQAFPLYLF